MSEAELLVERDGAVATLTLNRPTAMNALSPSLLRHLCNAFRELQGDKDIRVAILTGKGRAFCAGLDLKALGNHPDGLAAFAIHGDNDVYAALRAFDRPIIMGINGVAATGGFELALMGDILIASSEARFGDTHCRVGLAPGWGLSQKLARIIGHSRAREAHFSGNFISAEQADAWGLVSRVVEPDALAAACRQLADDIAGCVPWTVKAYKALVNDGLEMTMGAGLAMEKQVMAYANARVSGDEIAANRQAVTSRGQQQKQQG